MIMFRRVLLISVLALLWGCPADPPAGSSDKGGDEAGDEAGTGSPGGTGFDFNDMDISTGNTADMEPDEPMEESPCLSDEGCFAGRICVDEMCVDAECQASSDCPPERPICSGLEGEEPNQRRGRCGDCTSDDECYGASTCVHFIEATDDEASPPNGVCTLDGACNGTLECAPSSRLVLQGNQGEVCLDRRSTERDPKCEVRFNCQGEDACPEGLRCLDSGECAIIPISETCQSSTECGFSQVCRQDQLCGLCQNDTDCTSAQSCQEGVCAEIPGACQNDDECLGARRCVAGECAPPQCEEDFFAGNSSIEAAVEIDGDRVYRELVSCEDDWYQVTIAPMMSALIMVRQLDRGADLGVQVLDLEERELGRSVGPTPVEAVRIRESAAPRILFVRVFQENALSSVAHYALEIAYTEPSEAVCLDDPFELNGGDDTSENARLIRTDADQSFPSEVNGQICAGDQDVLCFVMRQGERLTVLGQVDLGDALLVGTLFDPQGGEIGQGSWAGDQNPMDIEQIVEQSGRYCLHLNSDVEESRRLGRGRYRLQFNGVSPEVAALCETSEVIAINNFRGSATGELMGSDVLRSTCEPNSDGQERVYTFNVTEPSLVVAQVNGLPVGTLGDPVISLRATCEQQNTELACSAKTYDPSNPYIAPPNPATLRTPITPPVDPVTGQGIGQYTLIVDGVDTGDLPSYQVEVQLRPLAPPPINETCERIQALTLENGVAVVNANLDQAQANLDTCGYGGPDVTYSFSIEQLSLVSIQGIAKPDEFPVIISLSDRCGGPALGCGYRVEHLLEPGEYHITLAGESSQSRGLVELQVAATPLPAPPTNETCSDSLSLEGDSGEINGNTLNATDDYVLQQNNFCTRFNSIGSDLAYVIEGQEGRPLTITATPEGGWDLSLYLLSSCDGDIEQNCLIGHDDAFAETVTYTPTQDGPIYIIVDGSTSESGPFTLEWLIADE
jgi:hypothetical protein